METKTIEGPLIPTLTIGKLVITEVETECYILVANEQKSFVSIHEDPLTLPIGAHLVLTENEHRIDGFGESVFQLVADVIPEGIEKIEGKVYVLIPSGFKAEDASVFDTLVSTLKVRELVVTNAEVRCHIITAGKEPNHFSSLRDYPLPAGVRLVLTKFTHDVNGFEENVFKLVWPSDNILKDIGDVDGEVCVLIPSGYRAQDTRVVSRVEAVGPGDLCKTVTDCKAIICWAEYGEVIGLNYSGIIRLSPTKSSIDQPFPGYSPKVFAIVQGAEDKERYGRILVVIPGNTFLEEARSYRQSRIYYIDRMQKEALKNRMQDMVN